MLVTRATVRAHVNGPQAHGLDSGHLVTTPFTLGSVSGGAVQAEDVFARDHSAVDENGLEAGVAAVDHRVDDLKNKTAEKDQNGENGRPS